MSPLKELKRPKYLQININKLMVGISFENQTENRDGYLSIYQDNKTDSKFLFFKNYKSSYQVNKNEFYLGYRIETYSIPNLKMYFTPYIFIKNNRMEYVNEQIEPIGTNTPMNKNEYISDATYLKNMPREHFISIKDMSSEIALGLGGAYSLNYNLYENFFIALDAQFQIAKVAEKNMQSQFHPARSNEFESQTIYDNHFKFNFSPIGRLRFGYTF